jgi:hydroxypyruvate isomerase
MLDSDQHDEAMQLFFSQHAMLHSAKMAQLEQWSFEDAILNDMTQEQIRRIPHNCEHSVAWNIWHIARIEDVTMNMLVAGSTQILNQSNWKEKMKISVRDTGNVMNEEGVADLSEKIDIMALREYRVNVGQQTRKIVKRLQPVDLKRKVDIARIQNIKKEGAVVDAASDLLEYWRKRNIAGLLLMPATRHNLVHLNEALQLKTRRH